jgi:ATP-dependent Clp protease ATP-binding subunit ClpC
LLDQPIDRQNEMHAITQIMTRESKNHPLLVSNRGVGASSLIYGIACSIAEGSVPELNCAHTYRIDITDLLGCPPDYYDKRNFNRGLAELLVGIPSPENIVIAIDSAFRPPGALGEAIWPINLLQRVLTCGKHRVIATATPSEYSQYLSQDGTVASFFEAIEVDELDASYAVEILKSVRKRYEARHQAVITDEAISAAVALSIRHMPERPLPGKALDLLDAAATRAAQRVFGQNLPSFNELENEIARLVSAKHAAIDNAEFDQAAAIRSAEADLRIALARKREGWATSAASLTTEVSGKDIAETVAALTATKSGPDITV